MLTQALEGTITTRSVPTVRAQARSDGESNHACLASIDGRRLPFSLHSERKGLAWSTRNRRAVTLTAEEEPARRRRSQGQQHGRRHLRSRQQSADSGLRTSLRGKGWHFHARGGRGTAWRACDLAPVSPGAGRSSPRQTERTGGFPGDRVPFDLGGRRRPWTRRPAVLLGCQRTAGEEKNLFSSRFPLFGKRFPMIWKVSR